MADAPEMNVKIGADSTDFKAQIASINREIRVLDSAFKASSAALGDWSNDATGLESRIKTLNGTIGLQTTKVNALQAEYDKVASGQGVSSRAAQELNIKLNKETETLNKMKTELSASEKKLADLGSESKDTGSSVEKLGDETKATSKHMVDWKGAMGGLKTALGDVAKVAAGLVASVAGIGAAVGSGVLKLAEYGDGLVDMSSQTGISTTRLQELSYAGKIIGTDLDVMTGSMSKMVRSMGDAQGGTGAAADAFAKLGISVTDSGGNLKDSEAVFGEAIDALGQVTNETERDALAMEIFGKSAQDLNPLIEAGSGELSRLTEEANKVGAVMSGENVQAAADFQDTLDGLKMGAMGLGGTLLSSLLPAFQGFADQAGGYLQQFSGIVNDSGGDVGAMAEGVGGLLGQIISDLAGQAPAMLEAGLGLIQSLLDALMSNIPVLIPAVLEIIQSLVDFILANIPMIMSAGMQIIEMLVKGLLANLPSMLKTAVKLIVTLATGLASALPTLIPTVLEIIPTIILALLENLPLLVDAALQLIIALVTGLVDALPMLIGYVPQIIIAVFNALIASLPKIGEAAVQLVLKLITGITGAQAQLKSVGPKIIGAINDGLNGLLGSVLTVGANIVTGVWNGIVAKKDWFTQQIRNFFSGIIASVRALLGISSPSKVFAGIGVNMVQGMSIGFLDQLAKFQNEVGNLAGSQFGLSPVFTGAGGGNSSVHNSDAYAFYAPVVIQGAGGQSLSQMIKAKRY